MPEREYDSHNVVEAVFELYLENTTIRDGFTVAEIAEHIGCSQSTVRKIFDRYNGYIYGVRSTWRKVPVKDRNYGGTMYHRRVNTWLPALEEMRERYLVLLSECSNAQADVRVLKKKLNVERRINDAQA